MDIKEAFTKVCSRCKQPKPGTPEFFYGDKRSSDGLTSDCKECRCEVQWARSRRYKQLHRESINAHVRQRYAIDEEFREYRREHGRKSYYIGKSKIKKEKGQDPS